MSYMTDGAGNGVVISLFNLTISKEKWKRKQADLNFQSPVFLAET